MCALPPSLNFSPQSQISWSRDIRQPHRPRPRQTPHHRLLAAPSVRQRAAILSRPPSIPQKIHTEPSYPHTNPHRPPPADSSRRESLGEATACTPEGPVPKDVLSWVWAWSSEATAAFEILKAKVAEISGLRPLDYAAALSGECPIYLFTDASNHGTGAWLGQGPDPDHAFPVAYDSRSLSAAERNYPTHEKELLAIVRALKLWRPLLLDVPIQVQTDHFTLKWFLQQRDLSERQKRWLGVLSRFDLRIDHISGVNNFIADALSRLGGVDDEQDGMETAEVSVAVLGLLGQDTSTITKVTQGYAQDQVMGAWLQEEDRAPGVTLENVENGQGVHQVLRWEGRLCVPDTSELREGFIRQCHDDVGHFGVAKTLEMVRRSYYWEGMRQDVVDYVSSCAPCQTSKSTTVKPAGRLHSLPVPQAKFLDIGIDFVGPLPTSQGFDQLIVITDHLTGYVVLIPTTITANAREVARLFTTTGFPNSAALAPSSPTAVASSSLGFGVMSPSISTPSLCFQHHITPRLMVSLNGPTNQ